MVLLIAGLGTGAVLFALLFLGYRWWRYASTHSYINNAYVIKANIVLAAQQARAQNTQAYEKIDAALAAFMSIFASQSTIPALNNLSGDLGVPLQFGVWILYGYLVAIVISIPVASFFSKVFSVRRYFLVCVCLFLVAFVGSNLVTIFPQMIMVKGIQGITAGGLTATALIVIVTQLPPAKRPIELF